MRLNKKCICLIIDSERSSKINSCRVQKMMKRSECLKQVMSDAAERLNKEICLPSKQYTTLLREYIIQVILNLIKGNDKVD